MSLEEMGLEELVGDLVRIGNLVDEAQEARSAYAPPEARARGKAQLPILVKCELLLSDELHRRLGGWNEMAEVAIDALAEEHLRQQGLQEAEEKQALGTTIREIEAAEAARDAAFMAAHPEVREVVDSGVPMEFHPPGECIFIPADDGTNWTRPGTVAPTHKLDVYDSGGPVDMTAKSTHKLHTYDSGDVRPSVTTPKALSRVRDDSESIFWAMKEAAWASLQHLGTDVLAEYMELWLEKHHDYGWENHGIWGCQGAIIRATDKLMRLKGTYFDGRQMKKAEDDWLDLIGYGLIGLVIERGQWPCTTLEQVLVDMGREFRVEDGVKRVTDTPSVIRCGKCGSPSQGLRSCPHQIALHGNDNPEYCTCCEDCTTRCRSDI